MSIQTERWQVAEGNTVALSEAELASPRDNEVLIETCFSYLSAGTELNVVRIASDGTAPQLMNHPLGYSLSGVVRAIGAAVDDLAVGDQVAAVGTGAFHSRLVTVGRNLVVKVPAGVSMAAASTAAMMCFAFEGIRKAELVYGENALVLGGGLMGQMSAQLATASGARVLLTDSNEYRLAKAQRYAETLLLDADVWAKIRQRSLPAGLEAVLVCFGGDATDSYQQLLPCMSQSPEGIPHGRFVFSGGAKLTVELASASGNVRILSSAKAGPGYRDARFEQGQDYPSAYVPWTVRRNIAVLLDGIARGQLDVDSLITHTFPFTRANEGYQLLTQTNPQALAVVFDYAK